jgi:hypothetical protein
MRTTTIPAGAAASPKSRRAALAILGAASALIAVPAAARAVNAHAPSADDRAIALWERRDALRQPILDAYRARAEAEARMPEWTVRARSFDDLHKDDLADLKEEERLSGLTAAELAIEATSGRLADVQGPIWAMPVSAPNVAAARIMIEAIERADSTKPVSYGPLGVALIALEHLRPSLRGIIAEHVAEFLDNPERILSECQAAIVEG